MEFFAGLIVGAGWWLVAPMLIISFIFEHNRRYGVTFWLSVLTLVFAKVAFGLPWATLGVVALLYVPIGFIWSFWRWRRHCNKIATAVENGTYSGSMGAAKSETNFSQHCDKIIPWIFTWPYGMLEAAVGDLIDLVHDWVRDIADRTYIKWSNDALTRIEEQERKNKGDE